MMQREPEGRSPSLKSLFRIRQQSPFCANTCPRVKGRSSIWPREATLQREGQKGEGDGIGPQGSPGPSLLCLLQIAFSKCLPQQSGATQILGSRSHELKSSTVTVPVGSKRGTGPLKPRNKTFSPSPDPMRLSCWRGNSFHSGHPLCCVWAVSPR